VRQGFRGDQLQMICKCVRNLVSGTGDIEAVETVYVCNCNGIRERQVRLAIAAGARRPADVFKSVDARPQCARCVCDMRAMIDEQADTLRYAAE
jgi:bacterioferritin-associated ferredoxin